LKGEKRKAIMIFEISHSQEALTVILTVIPRISAYSRGGGCKIKDLHVWYKYMRGSNYPKEKKYIQCCSWMVHSEAKTEE